MKKDYIKLFSFMVGVALIITSVVYAVTNNYKGKKQKIVDEEKKLIDQVNEEYNSFEIIEEEFTELRDKTLNEISDYSSFYTGMDTKYESVIASVKTYDEEIKKLADSTKVLSKICVDKSYSDQTTNQKCINFIYNYEKSVNTFIGDIAFFNKKINDYNTWTETENESPVKKRTYSKVENYTATSFTDYIDVNKDGVYLGKVETKEENKELTGELTEEENNQNTEKGE